MRSAGFIFLLVSSFAFAGASASSVKVEIVKVSKSNKKSGSVDISYPKLVWLKDKKVLEKINKQIFEEAKEWTCDDSPRDSEAPSYTVTAKVERADSDVLSYTLSFDYYCGGAYPEAYQDGRTFDLKTGAKLELSNVLSDAVSISDLAKEVKKNASVSSDCVDAYSDIENFRFHFDSTGLIVTPDFPHALRGCEQELHIIGAKLKTFVKPAYR